MLTTKQIDAILAFLDRFEAPGFSAGVLEDSEGRMLWFNFDELVMEFYQALYDNDWINPQFDWIEWQESAREFIESPPKVENADLDTIQKLFTTHVRADRFNEGHLASMFKNGHIVALLRRLSELRKQIGD